MTPDARPYAALLGWALALAIAGLVSMHGLGTHGVAVAEPVTHAAHADSGAPSDEGSSGHGAHAVAATCLALLVGLGVLLLVRGRAVLVLRLRRVAQPGRVPAYGRGADPPDLHRLCVLRC